MADLIELVVGEGTEFKLLLETTPSKIKKALNSSMRSYVSPSSSFAMPFAREGNVSLFRFFRVYGSLSLKPLVFKFAMQSEELAKAYGTMLGFAIAHLGRENLPKEKLESFIKVCEKAVLQRAYPKLIESVGAAALILHTIKEKSPIPIPEVYNLERILYNSESLEQIVAAIKEIAKINSLISPRTNLAGRQWAYSQLQA